MSDSNNKNILFAEREKINAILNPKAKSEYKIIDDALDKSAFFSLQKVLIDYSAFPWYYGPSVTFIGDSENKYCLFYHLFYSGPRSMPSQYFNLILPILDIIKPNSLVRIKANLYPNSGDHHQHDMHVDYEFPHKGAIFFVNTNNGFTILEDGTKIENKENRLLLFDTSRPHTGTTSTDTTVRCNIIFNYT